MFKLLNQKIIVVDSFCKEIKTFIYENRKIISVSEKTLKSTSKIDYGLEKHHMFLINENEIVLYYQTLGFAFFSNSLYIGFFDIKNDKRIQYYECEGMNALALINDKLFIFAYSNRLYPVDLTNHSKKKDFKIEKGSTIHSIFTLNENQFLVTDKYNIYQFELLKKNKFTIIHTIKLDNFHMLKYPKNRLLFTEEYGKNNIIKIYLYC